MPSSVAIIIPVYNVTEFLKEALESAVKQKYPAQEIIVVNDGSHEDATRHIVEICSKFPKINLIHQPHAGTAAARNTGLRHCSADYIYFLDGDDKMRPAALRYLVKTLDKNPQAIACYACYRLINATGRVTSRVRPVRSRRVSGKHVLHKLLEIRLPFIMGTVLIRKHVLDTINVHNLHLKYGEDWALWCQLALVGEIIYAGGRVIHYCRKHGKNSTASFVSNPEPIFSTYDVIYKNPDTLQVIGKDELERLQEIAINHVHMKLAGHYSASGNIQKAQSHLQRMTLPPKSFRKRLEKE